MKPGPKKIISLAILTVLVGCSYSQSTNSGKPWKATVKVIDEAGQPVDGADVTIGYYVPPPEDETIALGSTKGKSDANGFFSASGQTRSVDLLFGAGKDGYYRSHLDHELGAPYQYDPVKWSPEVTLVLRKIGQPIPMYAKREEAKVQKENEPVGFDLMAGD